MFFQNADIYVPHVRFQLAPDPTGRKGLHAKYMHISQMFPDATNEVEYLELNQLNSFNMAFQSNVTDSFISQVGDSSQKFMISQTQINN